MKHRSIWMSLTGVIGVTALLGCEGGSVNAKKPPPNPVRETGDTSTTGGGDTGEDTGPEWETDTTNPCLGENPPSNCQLVPSGPACGDGEINQPSEVCDDGNTLPGDGCTGICRIEPHYECPTPGQPCHIVIECGNGLIEAGEVCDDGNKMDNDGCNATCDQQSANYVCPDPGQLCERVVFCGDLRVNGEETCEDGNTVSNDGCDANCNKEPGWVCPVPGQPCVPGPRCGDGTLSVGNNEVCDDGNLNPGDGCDASCQIESGFVCPAPGEPCRDTTVCGDARVTGKETCDDANDDPTDGCDACVIQPGYECPFPGAKCLADCGDGILFDFLGEECDDGNESNGDGCTSTCEWEDGFVCDGQAPNYTCRATVCGDGIREGTEACDDANKQMGDGCTPFCDIEPSCVGGICSSICGDGLLLTSMGEVCDDGNQIAGDGCSASCTVEEGSECKQPPIGESMTVPIIIRDFSDDHIDFEPANAMDRTAAEIGMVEDTLDGDGKPVFTGQGDGLVSSASSFSEWYRDIPGTNATIPLELVLYDNGDGGYVNRAYEDGTRWYTSAEQWCGNTAENLTPCDYEYDDWCDENRDIMIDCVSRDGTDWGVYVVDEYDGDPLFFPIDNHPDAITSSGEYGIARIPTEYDINESWPEDPSGERHNFHFTSEVRYWFQFDPATNPSLEFTGDDDVWVFINNRLAVDLGGIHTPVNGSVTLSDGDFGMVAGEVYEIVVFQAERKKESSTYRLTLSGFNAQPSDCGPICGDAVMSPGEQCDDGENLGSYNACMPDCTRGPYCGDAVIQGEFEDCDDGLNISAYGTDSTGCSPGCVRPPYCGDGIIQDEFGEVCDDGVNDGSYGGCSPDCLGSPWCGDAVVSAPQEACDDGLNDGSYGTCAPGCVLGPRCGDGVLQDAFGETCDDGNDIAGDGCSPNCREEGVCGDAIVDRDDGEECDDGVNSGNYGECAPSCILGPHCGDAVTNGPEECDDGVNGGDYGSCAPGCVLGPRCGDGLLQPGFEECDDANDIETDLCSSACKEIVSRPI